MSHLAATNADEPPRKTNQPPSSSLSSPSLFSLPLDMVLNVLARVPKRYHPILSCVCKNLRSLVRSTEIQETRSLLGKDSLYICFMDETYRPIYDYWYALRRTENSTTENRFDLIDDFSYPPEHFYSSHMIVVGPEIFFIPGSHIPSSSLWIFDTRSEEWRQGPSLLVKRRYNSVGLVGGKIYVIEGCRDGEITAERFDLKTQTWEAAPTPDEKDYRVWIYGANVTLDRKVYALCTHEVTSYVTRDGSCQRSEMLSDEWLATGTCVIENVLYVYFFSYGLLWYDTELKLWRAVYGLDLGKPQRVAMAEYYGKLAFLWEEEPSLVNSESKEIWCRMIVLLRSDVGIHGTSEPSQLLGTVPHGYEICHCLSLSR